ncbi:unnamed protein product, partial [Phaeothamnion confervicola]
PAPARPQPRRLLGPEDVQAIAWRAVSEARLSAASAERFGGRPRPAGAGSVGSEAGGRPGVSATTMVMRATTTAAMEAAAAAAAAAVETSGPLEHAAVVAATTAEAGGERPEAEGPASGLPPPLRPSSSLLPPQALPLYAGGYTPSYTRYGLGQEYQRSQVPTEQIVEQRIEAFRRHRAVVPASQQLALLPGLEPAMLGVPASFERFVAAPWEPLAVATGRAVSSLPASVRPMAAAPAAAWPAVQPPRSAMAAGAMAMASGLPLDVPLGPAPPPLSLLPPQPPSSAVAEILMARANTRARINAMAAEAQAEAT